MMSLPNGLIIRLSQHVRFVERLRLRAVNKTFDDAISSKYVWEDLTLDERADWFTWGFPYLTSGKLIDACLFAARDFARLFTNVETLPDKLGYVNFNRFAFDRGEYLKRALMCSCETGDLKTFQNFIGASSDKIRDLERSGALRRSTRNKHYHIIEWIVKNFPTSRHETKDFSEDIKSESYYRYHVSTAIKQKYYPSVWQTIQDRCVVCLCPAVFYSTLTKITIRTDITLPAHWECKFDLFGDMATQKKILMSKLLIISEINLIEDVIKYIRAIFIRIF